MTPWRCCARWMHGRLIYGALMLAPPLGAGAGPHERTAVSATVFARPAVQVWQVVTFNRDDQITAVCLVAQLADSSVLYLPFTDAAVAPPRSVGAHCERAAP